MTVKFLCISNGLLLSRCRKLPGVLLGSWPFSSEPKRRRRGTRSRDFAWVFELVYYVDAAS